MVTVEVESGLKYALQGHDSKSLSFSKFWIFCSSSEICLAVSNSFTFRRYRKRWEAVALLLRFSLATFDVACMSIGTCRRSLPVFMVISEYRRSVPTTVVEVWSDKEMQLRKGCGWLISAVGSAILDPVWGTRSQADDYAFTTLRLGRMLLKVGWSCRG